jgi:hypothetical protein
MQTPRERRSTPDDGVRALWGDGHGYDIESGLPSVWFLLDTIS